MTDPAEEAKRFHNESMLCAKSCPRSTNCSTKTFRGSRRHIKIKAPYRAQPLDRPSLLVAWRWCAEPPTQPPRGSRTDLTSAASDVAIA